MSQYRKTIVAEFFFKAHSPLLEMILFWKQTSSQLLKFADIFGTSFLQEHAPVSSFSQHDKPITRERNVIHFGGYFIYGGHFMNRQCQASDMQVRKCMNIASQQFLNWIRLIQVGNIQGCFVDLKLYFSLSKLVQSLFKSVFIQLGSWAIQTQLFEELAILLPGGEQTRRVRATSNSYCHSNKNV